MRSTVNYQLTAGQEIEALTTTENNGVGTINPTGKSKAQLSDNRKLQMPAGARQKYWLFSSGGVTNLLCRSPI